MHKVQEIWNRIMMITNFFWAKPGDRLQSSSRLTMELEAKAKNNKCSVEFLIKYQYLQCESLKKITCLMRNK